VLATGLRHRRRRCELSSASERNRNGTSVRRFAGAKRQPCDGRDDHVGVKERRESPRLRCSGSVEFQAEGGTARMWGILTDISLHGCYVKMSNTFPVDTKVDLVLKSCGLRIQTAGRVRASYPALGMGIRFSAIDPAEQAHLKRLLALLAGQNSFSGLAPVQKTREQEEKLLKDCAAVGGPEGVSRRDQGILSEEPVALP
jgi:PilZ domain